MFNPLTLTELAEFASIRGCSMKDLYFNQPEYFKGRHKVNDPGHGYMIIRKTDPAYLLAAGMVDYGHRLKGGTILLEEDCEAPELCKMLK